MEFTVIIDFIFLIGITLSFIWIFSIVSGYGGVVGESFKMIGWGAIVMGVSHIVEAVSLYLPNHHEAYSVILLHHFLAVSGFIIMAFGFKKLIKK